MWIFFWAPHQARLTEGFWIHTFWWEAVILAVGVVSQLWIFYSKMHDFQTVDDSKRPRKQ